MASADDSILADPAKSDDSRPRCLVLGGSVSHRRDTSLASEVRYGLACSYNEYAQLETRGLPYHGAMPILTHVPEKSHLIWLQCTFPETCHRKKPLYRPQTARIASPGFVFICAVQLRPGLDRFADMHLTNHAYFARATRRVARRPRLLQYSILSSPLLSSLAP